MAAKEKLEIEPVNEIGSDIFKYTPPVTLARPLRGLASPVRNMISNGASRFSGKFQPQKIYKIIFKKMGNKNIKLFEEKVNNIFYRICLFVTIITLAMVSIQFFSRGQFPLPKIGVF